MSREWKPGEIWLVECPSWAPGEQRAVRYDAGWYWLDDSDHVVNDGIDTPAKRPVTPLRPLLVIDPENREQVEQLSRRRAEIEWSDVHSEHWRDMQAALRALANPTPPKPDEPQGLGAVVEDSEHRKWVRHDNTPGSFPWVRAGHGVSGWSDIDAVRVLSEGVTR